MRVEFLTVHYHGIEKKLLFHGFETNFERDVKRVVRLISSHMKSRVVLDSLQ